MLTTTVDGLWALQALTGIEVLGPELGLRPLLPRVETPALALRHPVAADLRSAGVLDTAGTVATPVVEWLTVLSRRDVALFIGLHRGDEPPLRVLLARYARWWAVLERRGDLVALGGVGTTGDRNGAATVVATQIERICGDGAPAPLRPVTLPMDAVAAAESLAALRAALAGQHLDGDQLRALMAAADPGRATRVTLVALQSGVDDACARTHIEPGAVTIIDTADGRLCIEQTVLDGRRWALVAPGSRPAVTGAVERMLGRLPAPGGWHRHRRAV